jgi:hypothetical protein
MSVPARQGSCLPHLDQPVPHDTSLALVVVLILVLVALGADPTLALASFIGIAAAAGRLSRG